MTMPFVQTIDRIAEAMQVPLVYDSAQKNPISGLRKAFYAPLPGLAIPFTIRAEKLFSFDQVGVVFHVMGNLWALAAHYEKTNSTTLFLIDQSLMSRVVESDKPVAMTPDKLILSNFNLKEAVATIRPAIVKSFIFKSGFWAKLPLPK